jgi:hypothetical protein
MANIYEVKVDRRDIEISHNAICEGKGWKNQNLSEQFWWMMSLSSEIFKIFQRY